MRILPYLKNGLEIQLYTAIYQLQIVSKSKRLNEGRFFFPLALQVRVCVFSSK